jgi:hypothetical protein
MVFGGHEPSRYVNVSVRVASGVAWRPPNNKPPKQPPPSPPHNFTNMGDIEAALAAIESLEPGEHFTYTEIADKYGVDRTTLSRRYRGVQKNLEHLRSR